MSVLVCGRIRPLGRINVPEHSPSALRALGHINMLRLPLFRKCVHSKEHTPLNTFSGASALDGRAFSAHPFMKCVLTAKPFGERLGHINYLSILRPRIDSKRRTAAVKPQKGADGAKRKHAPFWGLTVCGSQLFICLNKLFSDRLFSGSRLFGGVSEGASPFMLVAPSGK